LEVHAPSFVVRHEMDESGLSSTPAEHRAMRSLESHEHFTCPHCGSANALAIDLTAGDD
jgi:hypothetical protein